MNWTHPIWVVIYPITSPPAIIFPEGAGKWAVVGKDNWTPYCTYLRSVYRTSPPLKRSQPPQTGLRRCSEEIFRPPETASLAVRGLM
ncbi:hypothetical protein AVEN_209592-1 [Araneus ventricosus]|uniref:Uncharacterized protein n=1 Tax=Araneus ventricosus TaxID=182803 RepID=A0A4Y2XB87_ARAVE|nr:hypothetical protein AVEN_227223-1 [Araneus ventricosus]GBO46187.1 hypothetical protein AVEN_209592-1 [Araneus ventricosus]